MPVLSNGERKLLARRVAEYQSQLFSDDGSPLLDYLTETRGLSVETIIRFNLGAVVNPVESDEQETGKIAIPYLTPAGPVAMRFRKMPDAKGPKYSQPAGSKLTIFNTEQFNSPKAWIVVTEGEVDCMTAVQSGLPAVGLPGVSAWRDHYSIIFAGYERVIIMADNDGNGDKGAEGEDGAGMKFAKKVAANVPAPAIFQMPEGHDVNSYYLANGAEALRAYIKVK